MANIRRQPAGRGLPRDLPIAGVSARVAIILVFRSAATELECPARFFLFCFVLLYPFWCFCDVPGLIFSLHHEKKRQMLYLCKIPP